MLLRVKAGLKGKWKRASPFISFCFYQEEKIVYRSLLGDFLQSTGLIWFLCFHVPTLKPAQQRAMGSLPSHGPITVHPPTLVPREGSPLENMDHRLNKNELSLATKRWEMTVK